MRTKCTAHGNQFTRTTDHGPQTTHFKSFLLGVSHNSILGGFGIFLAKKLFESSKFSDGNFFTWPIFSHFVRVLEYI